ncbi:MAG: DUF547 domain-containing protein [Bacteroidota bacterium]|nr:DUF547 domain-containing protein [Bacteroidota bacterium]
MKSFIFFMVFSVLASGTYAQNPPLDFFKESDKFFKEYVDDGRVNYAAIKDTPSRMKQLVAMIGDMDYEILPEKRRLAFLINTYNILVIKSVIAEYPISSPMDVPGFFDRKKHWLGGRQYTLNEIENKLIRDGFKDARIHFVLVCAAVSCPPIVPYAYKGDRIDEQLEERSRITLNDDQFIRLDKDAKKVQISEIFKWYRDDFYRDAKSLRDYINHYREGKIPENYEIAYYPYDWSLNEAETEHSLMIPESGPDQSNIQEYTPSKLLRKTQIEMQLFNNLYSQTAYRDGDREVVDLNSRQTYYTGLFYFLYGISENSRINIGLDMNIRSVRIDSNESNSPFKIFAFAGPPNARTAIATLGPKIKFRPFENFIGFSVQSAFWIPVASDLDGSDSGDPWLDHDMFTWWNQFFYDRQLSDQFQVFTEIDLLFRFEKDFEMKRTHLQTPVSFFLNYFPDSKFTVYLNAQYAPAFMKERMQNNELGDFTLTEDYAQAGLGVKYQLTSGLNLEMSYSNFFTSMNGGAGNTYNLGIRYIR